MKTKTLICPARRRRVPERFSWVDHRLVKDGHFKSCGHGALSLYLFLVIVGDADGLSYYGTDKLCDYLKCGDSMLKEYRNELLSAGLIAYEDPFYQVLELNPESFDRSFFSGVLRKAVRESENGKKKDGLLDMHSPYWRKPDDWRPVQRLGSIIENMTGGE